ncbi:MAG TPA: glycosyltransferase family 39 protein [Blastocatellia bacterium]|nr:glycosyltransferase family 39 protein [Blastocatellia bacterium]
MASSPTIDRSISGKERAVEFFTIAAVLAVSAGVYALLFNRSNVLSHSIGYNLYASDRVLEGAVPYRDFHTLYPPATFYLNAALFRWLGVSLQSALIGVLIFKVLTVGVIYMSGRQVMPRIWAVAAAISGLLWLRPNGPFKSVPMHYGGLFLALAMLLLLKSESRGRLISIFLAGASLGFVALFKHNIGAYALAGSFVLLLFEDRFEVRRNLIYGEGRNSALRRLSDKLKLVEPFALLSGCAAAVIPAVAYMEMKGALLPMIRTLLFGPGEFLLSRLAIPLSPVAPAALVASLAASAYFAHRFRGRPALALLISIVLILAIFVFVLRGNQSDVNQLIFYLPMFVLACGLLVAVFGKSVTGAERRTLLIILIFSAAALMELFPRFAREQSIAAMPFVMLFLFYLLHVLRPAIRVLAGGPLRYRLAMAVLPMTFLMIEGRLFFNTYFDSNLRFKAGTRPNIERGGGVYFPAATAALIDDAVTYIQQRVPAGGNAFAQSDAGTSLLFLSNRKNVSNAQFWIGVGVTQEERAATLERIDKSQTKLVITSDEVLAAEKYKPMRDYIERNFRPSTRFEDVLMLER